MWWKILCVNFLTAARGASIFFLGYFFSIHSLAALGWVILFMLSDWLDGLLARKWNAATKLGAVFDPLVDKMFYFGGLWFLTPLVPVLSEVALKTFWPEFFLMVIRIPPFPRWLSIQTPATQCGKIKMVCQSFALVSILWGIFLHRPDIIATGISFANVGIFLSFLSLYSHFDDPFKTA